MKSGIFTTTLIVILVIVLPIVLMIIKSKSKGKKVAKNFKGFTDTAQAKLDESLIHRNFAIGLDHNSKTLYYYKSFEDQEIRKSIPLESIKNCTIANKSKTVNQATKPYQVIEELNLLLTSKSGVQSEVLGFYNFDQDYSLDGELALITEWEQRIKKCL